jgi:hypothetical protein
MPTSFTESIDLIVAAPDGCAVEPLRGRGGLAGTLVAIKDRYFLIPRGPEWATDMADLLARAPKVLCWDLRRLHDWPLDDRWPVLDARCLLGGETSILRVAQRRADKDPTWARLAYLEERMAAHLKALAVTGMDLPASQAAPERLILEWAFARAQGILRLSEELRDLDEYLLRWPFVRALREVERNGIAIDQDFVDRQLLSGSPDQAAKGALRSLQGLSRDGRVLSLCNPMGGKTGRLRHEGGFNTLAIPHGLARQAIISRYPAGQIASFDFNAIDYRCIVNSVGGDVRRSYHGAKDFHERTASFIFREVRPNLREAIKYLSYIYIYGGSEATLIEKTGWTEEQVRSVLERLDTRIGPIKEFREKLWMQAQEDGFVEVPGGRRAPVGNDPSPGKVIGLYAQSYSSWVFEQAFVRVHRHLVGKRSQVIFAVHDELVIDMHPDELDIVGRIQELMQLDGHAVAYEIGKSYGELA